MSIIKHIQYINVPIQIFTARDDLNAKVDKAEIAVNKVGVYDVIVGVSSASHDLKAQKEYSDQWVKFNQQDKNSVLGVW